MNKLLQHIIDAGDVDHRILPGLQKMQGGGKTTPKRGQNVIVDGKTMNTYSDEYEQAYKKGIGQWINYDKASGQWKPMANNLPNSAYKNAEFVSSTQELPEVTVTAKMNPYVSAARKKAKEQAGQLEAFRKQEEAGYPKWYKYSSLYNPEKDKQTQEEHYNNLVNRSTYQNLVDAIPQKEGEGRIDYMDRFKKLAGNNSIQQARAANVTEPFDPNNLAKLGQWGWKGLNHLGAVGEALFTNSPKDFMSSIQRGIDRGNQPTYGMLPDEAKEVGVFQPFETVDDLAFRYGFKPILKAGDNFVDPAGKQTRALNQRYLGPSETDKIFTSLLNPLNYVSGAEILNGGKNLARVAKVGEGLENLGRFAVTKTPLRNAYKYNPYAEKLIGKTQRQIFGDPAYESFLKYGPTTQPEKSAASQMVDWVNLERDASPVLHRRSGETMNIAGTTKFDSNGSRIDVDYPFAYFSEGTPWYGPKRSASMTEALGAERRIVPKQGADLGFYPAGESSVVMNPEKLSSDVIQNYAGRRRVLAPSLEAFNPQAFDVYNGTPHWLKGFQKVGEPLNDELVNLYSQLNNKLPQSFGPGNSNSGFLNFMNARGVEINPSGIIKDYYTGLKAGLPDAIPNALGKFLRNTGIYPKAKNVGKPFSEVFPTGATRAARMAEQDRAFQHGQDFINEYLYPGGSSELRPEVVDRIREIIPDSKLATSTDNFSKNGDLINGVQLPNFDNPYVGTNQRLVKSTTWGSGREGVPLYDINTLNNMRSNMQGVNIGETGNAYTVRNFGPYYMKPYSIARTGVHENAHTFQKLGFKPSGSSEISNWGDQLAKYDSKLKYYVPNQDTDMGKLFAEHMVEPTKKTAWESAPIELHSELMAEKYNDFMKSIQRSDVPGALFNKDLHRTLIDELANPTDETLKRILDYGKLNQHFKPETTLENRIKLLKLLPAALPVAGAAATMGASEPKQQKYGGENNMFRVFAEDGVEYKGPSIVDYLATKGYSGSKAFRKGLAEKYGVEDYDYSAAKNTELLNKLRANDDLLEKEYEQTAAPISVEKLQQMEQQAQARPQRVRTAQPQVSNNKGSYYFPRPDFMDMEIPKFKFNLSLQPKVIYDKFSLKPKMVIPMPKSVAKPSNTTALQVEAPANSSDSLRTTPPANYPSFDPYFFTNNAPRQNQVVPAIDSPVIKSSLDSTRVAQGVPQTIATPAVKFQNTLGFNNYDPTNPFAFLQQKQSTLGPYIPANKPVVKTKMNDSKSSGVTGSSEEPTWYERLWNSFSDAVNNSDLDFSKMTMSPAGFTPEGTNEMVKDLTIRAANLVSPEKGRLVSNYFTRQSLKNNDKLQETKTKLVIPQGINSPDIITGDTIPLPVRDIKTDIPNRYLIPGQTDLTNTKWGYRNRGDYRDITTEGGDITLFEDLIPAKEYFKKNPNSKDTDSFIGLNPDGSVVAGNKKDFINSNAVISHTVSNKIIEFPRDANGKLLLKNASKKASSKHLSPVTKTLEDNGNVVLGSLNFLIPKKNQDPNSFGDITGGRVIFKAPDGKMKLAVGSAENIAQTFDQFKKEGNYPYLTAFVNDNGTYGPGLRTKSGKITGEDLKKYQGANETGSVLMYLKPGNYNRVGSQSNQLQFKDVQMNTPNIRTKNDESFKKGHPLTNEQKAIILHHTGYSDTSGVSKGMSKAMQGVAKQFSQPGESSHIVIDFDGTRYNYARPDQVTFHAGKSMMNGRDNVNDFGIGIEFQGDTDKTRLTDKQINSFVEYAGPIIKKNKIPLSSIITHKQIRSNYMKANPKDKEVLGKPDVNEIDYKRIIQALKKKGYYAQGGPVVDPMGQWAHPGKVTRIPGSDITMQGVPYPVLGIGNNGKKQVMYPGKNYNFGGASYVDEYPMMQTGGPTLPEVTVYGHRNPGTKAYFDKLRKSAEESQDRESYLPMAEYLAKEQLYSKYGAPKINMIGKDDRPYYNPFTDSLNIVDPDEDYQNMFLDELAHKIQANKKGRLGFTKDIVTKDLFNTFKNINVGDIFNRGAWKDAYQQNYYNEGTVENDAHENIYPKLKDEFTEISDKEWNKMVHNKKMQNGGGLLSKTVSCSNCGWSWQSVDGGADPMTCHKCGGTAKMKNGGYTVTRSNDRKGKTHKVTGPDGTVKYFGDSKLGQHPKDPQRKAAFYARHKKNLQGNPFFRAFARKTWEDGGETGYMQGGGLWDTDKVAYLDSTVNANKNLEFIQRAMQNNGMSIPTPQGAPGYGQGKKSSHLMTFDPRSRRAYPELVNMNGTLKYLTGDDAYNYAEDTGEYIQFPTAEQADYFSQNYKKSNYIKVGKQPLEKKHGIKVNYKK